MNSGTPTSVALPERSSRGMIDVREHGDRLPLVRAEELRDVARTSGGRRGLRGLPQLVGGRHLGVGPGEASGQRRGRQQAQHLAAIHGRHQIAPALR